MAEGLETALAVHQATGLTVWPAVCATLLERLQVPPAVAQVVIWADQDRNGRGQQVALQLAERLRQEGRSVHVCLPAEPLPANWKSLDWLDVLVQHGPAAVQAAWSDY